MKKIMVIALVLSAVTAGLIIAGCSSRTARYGSALTETKITSIAEILKRPDNFSGKPVRVEGKIAQECPAGGWVMLKDDTGIIFVDMHPAEIAIPQAVNHSFAAQGKVKKENGQVSVVGEGVELK